MKRIFLLLLLGCSLYTQAQESFENAARRILQQQSQDWNRGDLSAFMQGYWNSDSLLFVGRNGPVYGYTTTLNNYRKNYPDTLVMGKLQFNLLSLQQLSDEHGFVLGQYILTRRTDRPTGFFTLWLRKIKGQWKIVADHSS
ncbi:MAG: YybH family protein [Bacteroidota bacterium]|jgi:ketosteroid isomerase-like protein